MIVSVAAAGCGRFEPSGETITVILTDATVITVNHPQGGKEGTAEDIAVGSVLAVTLDDENQAEDLFTGSIVEGPFHFILGHAVKDML